MSQPQSSYEGSAHEGNGESSFSYLERPSFPLSELEPHRKITIEDDKGRKVSFRVNALTDTEVAGADGSRARVPFLSVRELEGAALGGVEQIVPGLYVEGGGLDVPLFGPRQQGAINPAMYAGLRLVVNPWQVYPMAATKITIQ